MCVMFISAAVPAPRWHGGFFVRWPFATPRITRAPPLNFVQPKVRPAPNGWATIHGGAVEAIFAREVLRGIAAPLVYHFDRHPQNVRRSGERNVKVCYVGRVKMVRQTGRKPFGFNGQVLAGSTA